MHSLRLYLLDQGIPAEYELDTFNTLWRYPLGPYVTSFQYLYGRWSTSVSDRGIAHFFTATRNTIEGTGEKLNRQTNNIPGVNSSAEGKLCNIVHMYTNASLDSSENSTMLLECRLIFPHCGWTLSHADWSLCSGVDWSPASPFANCFLELLCPTLWPAFPSYFRSPEISSPKPFVWFRAKSKESSAWRTTYIVLQRHHRNNFMSPPKLALSMQCLILLSAPSSHFLSVPL